MEYIIPILALMGIIMLILLMMFPAPYIPLDTDQCQEFEQGDMVMYVEQDHEGEYLKDSGSIFIIQSINPDGQIEWQADNGFKKVDPRQLIPYNTDKEREKANKLKSIINKKNKDYETV